MTRKAKIGPVAGIETRCAIYTRKSTEEGLDLEFNSLDAQRESAEAYIASQKNEGWICLPERYDDGGYTGGNMDRPAVKKLLMDIEAGKIDCVVVYKVDRLSRSLLDFAKLMESFEKHHVSFVSVTQQFNTTHSMGRLTLNILLSFAQFEREIIGERIRDKLAAQRRKGKWAGGRPILGYDVDRTQPSPKLVVNSVEAARVRAIYRFYLEQKSLLSVANELDKRGWCNKQWVARSGETLGGRPFDKCAVYNLLVNPLYVGKIKHNSELFDGEHEALVERTTWDQAQRLLHQNGRTGGVEVRNRYGALLKRLLYCKACNRAMIHSFTAKGSRRYRYYVCTKAIKNGHDKCPTKSLPAAEIERVVLEQIQAVGRDAEIRAEVLKRARKQSTDDIVELQTELRHRDRELARWQSEIRKHALTTPSAATTALLADLHDRVRAGECRAAELKTRISELEREQVSAAEVEAALADFDNLWNSLTIKQRVEFMSLIVARVEFDPTESTVEVTFHQSAVKSLVEQNAEANA